MTADQHDDGRPIANGQRMSLPAIDYGRCRPRSGSSRIKRQLHQQLITGMDLSAIGTMNEEELRLEVRRAAEELCRHSSDLLNLSERERLVSEVLDETFGLGPLEPLMRDPTITRHPGQRPQDGLRRAQGPAGAGRHRLQRRPAPGPDHPADRGPGRPAGRRDQPDGRRPARRRQPRQRDHPAAGPGRRPAVDPPVRRPAAPGRTTWWRTRRSRRR